MSSSSNDQQVLLADEREEAVESGIEDVPSENDEGWFSETPSGTESPLTERRSPLTQGFLTELQSRIRRKIPGGWPAARHRTSRDRGGQYKVYPWRWFMLASLTLLNLSNGTMWLTFAPIPNYTAVLYGVTLDQVDWFSISYFVVSLVIGFLAIAILDIFGLRTSLYLGAGFNLLGSILRWLSASSFVLCSADFELSGYLVAMLGQILTACAQPFLLYAPTKLASLWFGPKERGFCTMLASIGNPVGLGLAQLISTNVVTSLDRFLTLHLIYTVPAAVGAACAVIAYWKDTPSVPPAASAHKDPTPFLRGLKQALTTPSFLLLLGIWGCSSGLFNALLTLLAQILCPFGYSDRASGLWGALMIFCGLIGATCGGLIIDYFKLFKEVAVVSFALALLSLIWFAEVFSLTGQGVNIAFSLCVFGFFGLTLLPVCMELGVEVTYPVSEATSSGLLWTMTQVMGIVLVLIGQAIQQDSLTEHSRCGVGEIPNSTTIYCRLNNITLSQEELSPKDLTFPLLLYLVVGFLALLTLAGLFRPTYKRLEVEGRAEVLKKLQGDVDTPPSSIASGARGNREQHQTRVFNTDTDHQQSEQTSTEL